MATVSQFAAPSDGEASFRYAYDTAPLGLPEAHERGDSFAYRSPPGTSRSHSDVRVTSLRWTRYCSHRKWRQYRCSQPPRDGEVSF